jgi:hypothetical protein
MEVNPELKIYLEVYYTPEDTEDEVKGWHWWAQNGGGPHDWYGDPEGPFKTATEALQAAATAFWLKTSK